MNVVQRAKRSLLQQFGKTIILLLLITTLGSLIAGAVLINRATDATMDNLRRSMPAIMSIAGVQDEDGNWLQSELITRATIRYIGALSYVSHYDYSVIHDAEGYFNAYVPNHWDMGGAWHSQTQHYFRLFGTSRPEVLYLEKGMYELIVGRTFTEEEMVGDEFTLTAPILVSQQVADLNNFYVGQLIYLNHGYFVLPEGANLPPHGLSDITNLNELMAHRYNNWVSREYQFEIVGIFTFTRELRDNATQREEVDHYSMFNLFFAPNWRVEEMRQNQYQSFHSFVDILQVAELLGTPPGFHFIDPFWVLNDVREIDLFAQAADELLAPYNLQIADLSGIFGTIVASTDNLNGTISTVMWLASVALVLVLTLLIILYLHDRKQEIGIYLALGERKYKIVFQILFEVLVVAIIGFGCAIFISNLVAEEISVSMLRAELVANARDENHWPSIMELVGFAQELSVDEMMEMFDVALDGRAIAHFFVISLGVVSVAVIIPIAYLLELNPKDILLKAKIE